jgi:hypothetical protein
MRSCGVSSPGRRSAAHSALIVGFLTGVAVASSASAADDSARALFSAERQAVGGDAWLRIGAVHLEGVVDAGDAPGTFTELVDHRSGQQRLEVRTGPLRALSGFDGHPWVAQNGIVTPIDLPSLVADAETQAFAARDGWWLSLNTAGMRSLAPQQDAGDTFDVVEVTPAHGSAVDVWFNRATHLITRTVAHTDGGELRTSYEDWRSVGEVRLPFRRVETDPTGERTIYSVHSASLEPSIRPQALARPQPQPHGVIAGGAATSVAFLFDAFDHGHIVVPARVNGRPVTLIFDTGAANYFPPATATRLGLVTGGGVNLAGVAGAGGGGGFARAGEVAIGAAGLKDEAVIVGPLPYVANHPRAGMEVDGLTGYEFLAEFRTTIDYAARTLSFTAFDSPAQRAGVTLPFLGDEHDIFVEATIDGATGLFRLDTGDRGGVTVFRTFADAHGLFQTGGRASVEAGGLGGALRTREFVGTAFTLAGLTLADLPVTVSEATSGSFASRSLAGNLGSGVLDRYRITFDYHARTLTFLAAPDAHRAPGTSHPGLSLTQHGPNQLEVLAVTPGSPAAAAGILAGDAITEVEGAPVSARKVGVFDLYRLLSADKAFTLTVIRSGATLRFKVNGDQSPSS